MHLLNLPPLLALLTLASAAVQTATLAYHPLSTPIIAPVPFAVLNHDSTSSSSSYSLKSYTPPPASSSASLIRVGTLAADGKSISGASTLVSAELLRNKNRDAVLKIQTDGEGGVWGVSFAQAKNETEGEKARGEWPVVQVVEEGEEPRVVMGKPVVVNKEGKVEEEPKEKTLIQK